MNLETPLEIAALPFGKAVWPWVEAGCQKLEQVAGSLVQELEPGVYFSLKRHLARQLSTCAAPSFVLEMQGLALLGQLEGETPHARYESFVRKRLLDKGALEVFFQEYRKLAVLIESRVAFWVEQTAEFLARLKEDFPLLEQTFGPLGKLTAIQPGSGDLHNEGRSVALLQFASGTRLVYKPKDLRISAEFQTLLEELNVLKPPCLFKTYKMVCRDSYGWEECVSHAPCASKEEVERFFTRQGMFLCLLYLLKGTDFHFENVIAMGENPMLIDLETLFSSKYHSSAAQDEAAKNLEYSVNSTALLPRWIYGVAGEAGMDISGLSGHIQQLVPYAVPVWRNVNTDQMFQEYTQSQPAKKIERHLCTFHDEVMQASDYVETLIEGFRAMYQLLQDHRTQLAARLWKMEECPVRVVLRSTKVYSQILSSLYAPQAILHQRIAKEVLKALDGLAPSVIKLEKKALLRGDIPYFYTFPTSRDLYAKGEKPIRNALSSAALEDVLKRLHELSDRDCERQIGYIRSCFFAISPIHGKRERAAMSKNKAPLTQEELLLCAEQLGAEILRRSLREKDGSLTWAVLEPNLEQNQYHLEPISDTLYSGRAGIALFFAALYAFTREKKWKQAALDTIQGVSPHRLGKKQEIGGMSGLGGILYALFHIAQLTEDVSLHPVLEEILRGVDVQAIRNDQAYDLIFGSAGLILSLLAVQGEGLETLSLAKEAGERLIQSARQTRRGAFSWKPDSYSRPLLGMAHGTTGIAYALLKLAKDTGDARFKDAALKGIQFERDHFSEKKGWPDLRKRKTFSTSQWCHGAVGIGLSRIACFKIDPDPKYREEIKAAVNIAKHKMPLYKSVHLCCGLSGYAELFDEAAAFFGSDPSLEHLATQVTSQIGHTIVQESPSYVNLGFMQGLAGIGYTLLRRIDRARLPQVLLLEN